MGTVSMRVASFVQCIASSGCCDAFAIATQAEREAKFAREHCRNRGPRKDLPWCLVSRTRA